MSAHTTYPVLPIALGSLSRALSAVVLAAVSALKIVGRAYRNRQHAHALAGLDRHMLADMGINHADLRDAFSSPIWEDPTELLQERAAERRVNRNLAAISIVPPADSTAIAGSTLPRPAPTRSVRAMI
ncbi:MAG: DUF1127 domain-containing protein [Pseudolabrys sp.]